MPINFLTRSRHNSIYYFRRRIPIDISHSFKNNLILKSLNTVSKKNAVILARNLASQTDGLFEEIRTMNKKKSDSPLASYIFKVDLDANKKPIGITIKAENHETDKVQSLLDTVLNSNATVQNVNIPTKENANSPSSSSKSFQDFIDEYNEKAGLKPSTIANFKSKLRFAMEYFGENSDILSVTQPGIVNLSEHVKVHIGNRTTQGLYIQIIVRFINWHRARNGLPDLNSKTLVPRRTTPDHIDREEFSLKDMQVIFNNAYTYSRKEPCKWWSTIAVAFLGCRIEEICQVNLQTDLIYDKENNIWYFKLDENPDKDGIVRKSLKKLSSWRHLPIHSVLVKHGFIDYLLSQKQKGYSRPFESGWSPRVVTKDNILKWSQNATKWGGRELVKLADKNLIQRDDKTYFHSMRHTFARLMQEAGVKSEVSEAIAGREAGVGEQQRYGKIKNNYKLLSCEGVEKALHPLVEVLESIVGK